MTKPSLLLCVLCACVTEIDEPDGPPQTCDSPAYGDGVCQTELACAVPDIDCFTTFPDDAAAAVWYTPREAAIAQSQGRPPNAILPTTDPRFAQARALLEKGWAAFRVARSVGKLADARVGMVLIDDPNPNAFVMSDQMGTKQTFSVHVNTGLLTVAATDDARLGVMMHELQHAVGLHGVMGVKDRVRIHYIARVDPEPIGRDQTDDAVVRTAVTGWRDLAEDVGPYTATELGPFPLTGNLWTVLSAVLGVGVKNTPTQCANANNLITRLRADVLNTVDRLGGKLTIPLSTLPARINTALVALRDQCVPNFSLSFVEVVAAITDRTPQEVAAGMTAADMALVSNKHVVNAVASLAIDRRMRMRTFQTMLPQSRPWSEARYFSTEEDADDVSVLVLREAGVEPTALADMMLGLAKTVSADAGARCEALLGQGGIPPYGVNLEDEHHDTCWRAYHIRQFADYSEMPASPRVLAPAPPVRAPSLALPFPRNPDIVIMD